MYSESNEQMSAQSKSVLSVLNDMCMCLYIEGTNITPQQLFSYNMIALSLVFAVILF